MQRKYLPVITDTGHSLDELLIGLDAKDELISSEKIEYIDKRPAPPVVTKEYVSYSEISTWSDCAFRHKLKYIDGINLDGPSEHTEFGQVIHDVLEEYLKSRSMPSINSVKETLSERFSRLEGGKVLPAKDWQDTIEPILSEVPRFLEEQFPEWEFVASEMELMEDIIGHKRKFKGFIDGVVKVPKRPRKGSKLAPDGFLYWVIDWKTTSWGWATAKKIDPKKTLQLALYKYFWAKKLGVDPKEIRCGFVLLKRTAKKEHCELVTVSVGEKAIENALGIIDQMLGHIKKGYFAKNRDSCKFCVYSKTAHCP